MNSVTAADCCKLPFSQLCEQLSALYVKVQRRDGDPNLLRKKALDLCLGSRENIDPRIAPEILLLPFVRDVSALLRPVASNFPSDVALRISAVAAECLKSSTCHFDSAGNVLDACLDLQTATRQPHFRNVIQEAYSVGVNALRSGEMREALESGRATSVTVLPFIRGAAFTYAHDFKFLRMACGSRALLPCRPRAQMEAKLQKSGECRQFLHALRVCRHWRKMDCVVSLQRFAQVGVFDEACCNLCCDALTARYLPTLSAHDISGVLFALGVMGHRSPHHTNFLSSLRFNELPPRDFVHAVQGLAMVHMCVEERLHKPLCDSLWKHTKNPYVCNEHQPDWAIDCAHALSFVAPPLHKFLIHVSRVLRCAVVDLSFDQLMKVLFTYGGVPGDTVPSDLRENWKRKAEKFLSLCIDKCGKLPTQLSPEQEGIAQAALAACGALNHPLMLRKPPEAAAKGAPPLKALFEVWRSISPNEALAMIGNLAVEHLKGSPVVHCELYRVLAYSVGVKASNPDQAALLRRVCSVSQSLLGELSTRQLIDVVKAMSEMGMLLAFSDLSHSLEEEFWQRRGSIICDVCVANEVMVLLQRLHMDHVEKRIRAFAQTSSANGGPEERN